MKLRPDCSPSLVLTSKDMRSGPASVGVSVRISVVLDIDAHVPSVGRSLPCIESSQAPSLSTAES